MTSSGLALHRSFAAFELMRTAESLCQLGKSAASPVEMERWITGAQRAYDRARIRNVEFTPEECHAFDSQSVRVETLIRELRARLAP
jgi:hypothetical protein